MSTFAALFVVTFFSSLIGSLHCAGMCGALVTIAVSGPQLSKEQAQPKWQGMLLQALYHGGRGVGYISLGAVMGAIGQSFDLAGKAAGLTHTMVWICGTLLILWGILHIGWQLGFSKGKQMLQPPKWLNMAVQRAQGRVMRYSAPARALGIGLLTPLLPCGFLYMFVFAAAGTGHPLLGAWLMLAFWLGTVPILATLGVGMRWVMGKARLHRAVQSFIALIMIAGGLILIWSRGELDLSTWHVSVEQSENDPNSLPPCCQEKADANNSPDVE